MSPDTSTRAPTSPSASGETRRAPFPLRRAAPRASTAARGRAASARARSASPASLRARGARADRAGLRCRRTSCGSAAGCASRPEVRRFRIACSARRERQRLIVLDDARGAGSPWCRSNGRSPPSSRPPPRPTSSSVVLRYPLRANTCERRLEQLQRAVFGSALPSQQLRRVRHGHLNDAEVVRLAGAIILASILLAFSIRRQAMLPLSAVEHVQTHRHRDAVRCPTLAPESRRGAEHKYLIALAVVARRAHAGDRLARSSTSRSPT